MSLDRFASLSPPAEAEHFVISGAALHGLHEIARESFAQPLVGFKSRAIPLLE